jgi:hypothetical protein
MSVKVGEIGVRRLKAFAEVMLVERMATAWSAPEVLAGFGWKPSLLSTAVGKQYSLLHMMCDVM